MCRARAETRRKPGAEARPEATRKTGAKARPKPGGAAGVVVRDARPGDVPAIAAVARRAWPAAYAGLFEEEFIELVLARTYSSGALTGAIGRCARDPRAHFLVAEEGDGHVIGYLHYGPGSSGPELHRLYVEPDRIREGIGSRLLAELNRRLASGTEYVALVREGNLRAVRFYERLGFEHAGLVDGFASFLERSGLPDAAVERRGGDMLMRYRVSRTMRG